MIIIMIIIMHNNNNSYNINNNIHDIIRIVREYIMIAYIPCICLRTHFLLLLATQHVVEAKKGI